MSRAHDLGSQYPSDAADSTPGDPVEFCHETDYILPGKYYGKSNGNSVSLTRIDLRRTIIVDQKNSRRTSLASLLAIARNAKTGVGVLAIRHDGNIVDKDVETRIGPVDYIWDYKTEKWTTNQPERNKPWWGKIKGISWPNVTVIRMTGPIATLTPELDSFGAEQVVTCYAGDNTGVQEGEMVYVQWSGEDTTPEWTIEQRLVGFGTIPPDDELAANQDVGE